MSGVPPTEPTWLLTLPGVGSGPRHGQLSWQGSEVGPVACCGGHWKRGQAGEELPPIGHGGCTPLVRRRQVGRVVRRREVVASSLSKTTPFSYANRSNGATRCTRPCTGQTRRPCRTAKKAC